MITLNTYLTFNGTCEAAFEFYQKVFGTELQNFTRYQEMPNSADFSESDKNRIMHVGLPIGSANTLMGCDTLSSQPVNSGTNISLSINTTSEAEAKQYFEALQEGATITMPLEKTFWNALFGMLTDKFGIAWMVNYDYPQE